MPSRGTTIMSSRPSRSRRRSYVELYEEEEFDVRLERRRQTRQHGLGLTVAGGAGSHPYKMDEEGIFVVRVVPGGAADMAGLRIDDEILSINGIPCYQLDHYQAVDMLRHSGGDIKVRVKRRSPRLVESAIPAAQNLGPLIRSKSSYQLPEPPPPPPRPPSRSKRSSSTGRNRPPSFIYEPEEESGYLRPRTPPQQQSQRRRRMSAYNPDPYHPRPVSPAPSQISASTLQHTHVDTSGGVHFHPYCFACNPSVIHILPPTTPQLLYPATTPPPERHHFYSRPNSAGYPSPVQLHTYSTHGSKSKGPKIWETETSEGDEDSSGRDRTTVRLRRDEFNGLGFVVSSWNGTPYTSSGGVYVSGIVKNGVADRSGQLFIGDRILTINGIDVQRARHKEVVELLSRSKPGVQLEIERPDRNGRPEEYRSEVFESSADDEAFVLPAPQRRPSAASNPYDWSSPEEFGSTRRKSSSATTDVPPAERLPKKSSLKQTTRPPSPPPPTPPPLDSIPQSNGGRMDGSRLSDMPFPPPPTELDPFRETVTKPSTKQTMTDAVVTPVIKNHTARWPEITEDVVIHKSPGSRLGLRIAGGKDSSCIPFGRDEPGIFISRVIPQGAAAQTRRLRIGDRILKINGKDVTNWTHPEVIRALCAAPSPEVVLTVHHDPPPEGLDEFLIQRAEEERFGIKVIGGVREQTSYQTKVYDSGIFVSKVHRGGAIARDGRVKVGMRLLEVNGTNVIGVTRQEAIEAFRRAGHILRLLVCDGWNDKPTAPSNGSIPPLSAPSTPSMIRSAISKLDHRESHRLSMPPESGSNSRRGSIHSARSASPTGSTKSTSSWVPKEPRFLGIKVSDLTGSRHFPKSPTPSIVSSSSTGAEKNREMKSVVVKPNSILRQDHRDEAS